MLCTFEGCEDECSTFTKNYELSIVGHEYAMPLKIESLSALHNQGLGMSNTVIKWTYSHCPFGQTIFVIIEKGIFTSLC